MYRHVREFLHLRHTGLDDRRADFCADEAEDQPQQHAEKPSDETDEYRLRQELTFNVLILGAEGFSDADLLRAFHDGYQHDVHDTDTADQQRDGRNDRDDQGDDPKYVLDLFQILHTAPGLQRKVLVVRPLVLGEPRLDVLLQCGHIFSGFRHNGKVRNAGFTVHLVIQVLLHEEVRQQDVGRDIFLRHGLGAFIAFGHITQLGPVEPVDPDNVHPGHLSVLLFQVDRLADG